MPKGHKDRTTGLPTGDPVVPSTSICFRISVPNSKEHRSALRGALSELGKEWTWETTVGEENDNARIAAELWRDRIADAFYIVDCDQDVSCAGIMDCINGDADVRNSIINMLLADQTFRDELAKAIGRGVTVSPTGITTPIVDDCDEDVLFGAVTYIIDAMHGVNEDLLDIIEAASNQAERLTDVLEGIPILDELPIGDIIGFGEGLLEDFQEGYDAAWTETYRDELRCALFCQALNDDDCKVTLETLWSFFGERVGTSTSIQGIAKDALQFIVTGSWSGTQLVDIMMYFQVVAWRFGSDFVSMELRSLELQAALGALNPNHEWVALDCPCGDDNCITFEYDTSAGDHSGVSTGIHVNAGDRVIADATGSYTHDGSAPYGPSGFPAQFAVNLDPDANTQSLMLHVDGEDLREWHPFDSDGHCEFIAPTSGYVRSVTNQYIGTGEVSPSTGQYVVNEGTFSIEICVEKTPVELEAAGGFAGESVEKIGPNQFRIGPTVYTGNYAVGGAHSIGDVPFRITSYSWNTVPEQGYVEIGGGSFNVDEIPDYVATFVIGLYQIPPGHYLTVTIERA